MDTYAIYFEITGTIRVTAASAEEAQAKFEGLSISDLADQGTLESQDPVKVEEDTP